MQITPSEETSTVLTAVRALRLDTPAVNVKTMVGRLRAANPSLVVTTKSVLEAVSIIEAEATRRQLAGGAGEGQASETDWPWLE